MAGWPSDFDVRTDAVFQSRIRPFIEARMADLATLDDARKVWARENLPADYAVTYIFAEHAERVASDMRGMALFLGLGEGVAENLYWAMLPHDIGKAALPVDLWDRVEKPDEALKALRRSHTEKGAEIAAAAFDFGHPFLSLMDDIMRHHHEQMDGGGYLGTKGADLSLPARLACIVESFDGYGIERPHFGDRDISADGVLRRMREEKGAAHYDMDLFERFAAYKTGRSAAV